MEAMRLALNPIAPSFKPCELSWDLQNVIYHFGNKGPACKVQRDGSNEPKIIFEWKFDYRPAVSLLRRQFKLCEIPHHWRSPILAYKTYQDTDSHSEITQLFCWDRERNEDAKPFPVERQDGESEMLVRIFSEINSRASSSCLMPFAQDSQEASTLALWTDEAGLIHFNLSINADFAFRGFQLKAGLGQNKAEQLSALIHPYLESLCNLLKP